MQLGCRYIAIKQISTLLARNVSRPYSAQNCLSMVQVTI